MKGYKTIDIFTYDLFHHRSFSRWSNTVVSLNVVRIHVPSTKCPHSSTSCYSTGSLQVLPVLYQSWLYFLSSTTKGIFHDAYLKFNLALWFQRNNFHCNKSIFVGCSLLKSFPSQDPSGNSPYCLTHNSQDVSSEILVLNQPVIPELTFCFHSHHLSAWYCSDIIMRNSVLVTLGSQTVNS